MTTTMSPDKIVQEYFRLRCQTDKHEFKQEYLGEFVPPDPEPVLERHKARRAHNKDTREVIQSGD